jgi:NodT family efflux transporter outer membrane factor (OMF) lipoprotein
MEKSPRREDDMKKRLVLVFTVLLNACAVGPDYVKPSIEVPKKYKEAGEGWKVADPQDERDRGPWWAVFNDPELDKLETQVIQANNSVAIAEAQYKQALSLIGQAEASFFPTVTTSVSQTRQTATNPSAVSLGSSSSKSAPPFNIYAASLTASWEPDLWGNVSRQVESAEAGAQASKANLASVQLSMQGTLAQTYFQLRALDVAQAFLDKTVEDYKRFLSYTKNRYKQGVAAQLDVIQAQTQLETAQVQAIDNGINRAQFEHAIAVLVGKPPAHFTIPPLATPLVAPSTPIQVPSSLLERRPDVAQAERQMQQTHAQIGVVVAAYFPIITLAGTGGYNSKKFPNWFTSPAQWWSLGPNLAAILFDAGLREAKLDEARATYDQSVATYRQTVLAAFQDVEDNLVSLRKLNAEVTTQKQVVKNAKQALKIVMNQYKSGTVDVSTVITQQTTAFTAEDTLIVLVSRQMTSAVGLIKALGGGWTVATLVDKKMDKCF